MRILFAILKGILVLALLFVIGFAAFSFITLRDFYSGAGTAEFTTAGLTDTDYDQQGLDYDKESGLLFFAGYMKTGEASRIYIVDPIAKEEQKFVQLQNADGTAHVNHSGGIAVAGDYIYMAGSSDDCLFVFDKNAVLAAENGAFVPCIGQIPLRTSDADGICASFIGHSGDTVYVGEFSLQWIPQYRLRENHKLTGASGDTNALMLSFCVDPSAPLGLNEKPTAVYALPEMAQGIAVYGDQLILSESFAYIPGRLETVVPVANGTYTILGEELPLYRLQTVKSQTVIPMAEGIVYAHDRIYISSEVINYVIPGIGKLWQGQWCWSVAP